MKHWYNTVQPKIHRKIQKSQEKPNQTKQKVSRLVKCLWFPKRRLGLLYEKDNHRLDHRFKKSIGNLLPCLWLFILCDFHLWSLWENPQYYSLYHDNHCAKSFICDVHFRPKKYEFNQVLILTWQQIRYARTHLYLPRCRYTRDTY
jgi:hypothetical protein